MTRPLLLLAAVLLVTFTGYAAQPAPVPVSGRFVLAPGSYEIDCLDGQPATFLPPNRAICPPDAPTPTNTPTTTPTPTTPPTPSPAPVSGFVETFDGTPGTPEPFRPSGRWDVSIHSRDEWYELDEMAIDHSPECGPPPAEHHDTSYEGSVFHCLNHLMVGIHGDGYAAVYLTPNHMVDLSQGEAVISWRMSTFRASIDRSWVDVWIGPFEDHLQLPLQGSFPDLQGPQRNGLLIRMQATRNSFEVFRIDNYATTRLAWGFIGYETRLVPSKTIRDLFEIRLSPTAVQVSMPEQNLVFLSREINPPLAWTAGVIQWGIHDYNSDKSTGSACVVPLPCTPSTWHFDTITIDHTIPFTIIPADSRYYEKGADVATFTTPAPAGSYLRFAGIGEELEISVDGGATWQAAVRQPGGKAHNQGHFASYLFEIPAGVTEVMFSGEEWYGGGWMVRDLSIWAMP